MTDKKLAVKKKNEFVAIVNQAIITGLSIARCKLLNTFIDKVVCDLSKIVLIKKKRFYLANKQKMLI